MAGDAQLITTLRSVSRLLNTEAIAGKDAPNQEL